MEPRTRLNEELKDLKERILKMGALVEKALRKAVKALSTDDRTLAEEVIAGDQEVDRAHHDIEDFATRVIALEQPVATDLRELISATKLASGLERIGDHARHIARLSGRMPQPVLAAALPSIQSMAETGIRMVHDALLAFVDEDVGSAQRVADRDDEIDAEHKRLYQILVDMMTEHPEWIDHGVDLMFLNRFLERLGDHVTNMCEWVIFARTGIHEELNK